MSVTLSQASRSAHTTRAGALFRLANACYRRIVVYFARRAAVKTLGELDDRALRDIGLARSQIEAAVHGFIPRSRQARLR